MYNPTLIKTFIADGAIRSERFVVLSDEGRVTQASSPSQYIIGTADRLIANDRDALDVVLDGIVEVEAGENLTAPVLVTSDSKGQAVAATSGDQIAGLAITDGVLGEFVSIILSPSYSIASAVADADPPSNDTSSQTTETPSGTEPPANNTEDPSTDPPANNTEDPNTDPPAGNTENPTSP